VQFCELPFDAALELLDFAVALVNYRVLLAIIEIRLLGLSLSWMLRRRLDVPPAVAEK
jgi:hypothetical protein